MRILVICKYFAPQNIIGAVRLTKFAKYLSRIEGVHVDVVSQSLSTEEPIDLTLKSDIETSKVLVLRIGNTSQEDGVYSAEVHSKAHAPRRSILKTGIKGLGLNGKTIRRAYTMLSELRKDRELYLGGKRVLDTFSRDNAYDVVISTYNSLFCHFLAWYYKKHYIQTKWVSDFRDPINYSLSGNKPGVLSNALFRYFINRADWVTMVNSSIAAAHGVRAGSKFFEIPNGFDSEDIEQLSSKFPELDAFLVRLVYTGALYEGRRDLTPIFRALSTLLENGLVDRDQIRVVYAGNEGKEFLRQAKAQRLDGMVVNLGSLSRSEALSLQANATALLLASWNDRNSKGIMTGKFFEYLMSRRPIIAAVSGECPGSKLKELIDQHHLGFCYEASRESSDMPLLCNYLESLYGESINGYVQRDTKYNAFADCFEYENIVRQMYELIAGGSSTSLSKPK